MCLVSWKALGLKACLRDLCSQEGECCSEGNMSSFVDKAVPVWKQTMVWPKLALQLLLGLRGTEKWSFVHSQASSRRAGPAWSIEMNTVNGQWAAELRMQNSCLETRAAGWSCAQNIAVGRFGWTEWSFKPEEAVPASALRTPSFLPFSIFTTILELGTGF